MTKYDFKLLANQQVVNWCYKPITDVSLVNTSNAKLLKPANDIEKQWARSVIGGVGNQWTTILCQELVREVLVALGRKNVRRPLPPKSSIRDKHYNVDIECDEYIYEIKGRSWTTPGTAGEKVLGVPLKYGELPKLYGKPLKVILVGYQEYEGRYEFAAGNLLDTAEQTVELLETLDYFNKRHIEYIGLTELLTELSLKYEPITLPEEEL